ncbi:TIP120-domain-containing protein [Dacryopinax primogenitus]|uniref:TIP120-domain-containing protein n=1 Tax=Dacryopinax primogenitus (strain DJM 731) TaxID=1858805 RepID=M5FPZ2_DACPD|nr:TIP120-domain-containing protein [Dacryopinax primogenitus]EJT98870.1 TIP120-domain-containing protein [Dacryopinax primogenitus]
MRDVDPDLRFMAMNDFITDMRSGGLSFDTQSESTLVDEVLKHMDDSNSEVKNLTVKCVALMIKLVSEQKKELIMNSLVGYLGGNKDDVRDLTSLALKTITMEIPTVGPLANLVANTLVPQLLVILKNPNTKPELILESLTVLTTVLSRLSAPLTKTPDQLQQAFDILRNLLDHSRVAVRKRAIVALANLIPLTSPKTFQPLLEALLTAFSNPAISVSQRTTAVQLLAAVGRHAPDRLAPSAPAIVESLISALESGAKDEDEESERKEMEELKEGALQALEQLVLGCGKEVTPMLVQICAVGVELMKYDPNYAGDAMDEDEDEVEEDEEVDDEEYDDDEDTSYKVRRSALKVLLAVIGTRPELLQTLYKSVGPALVSRFADREESVRIEVWATLTALVKQAGVYGSEGGSPRPGKRKREEEGMEVVEDEGGLSQLRQLVPAATKSLLKQLTSKSNAATLTSGFTLLQTINATLPGVLAPFSTPLLSLMAKLLSGPSGSRTPELTAQLLQFLTQFFAASPPRSFGESLNTVAPALLNLLGDRFPRVAGEAFRAAGELVKAVKMLPPSHLAKRYAERIYTETVRRLNIADTDAFVKERALEFLGDVVSAAGEVAKDDQWMNLLRARGEMQAIGLHVVERVVRDGADGVDKAKWEAWLDEDVDWCLGVIRRGPRNQRVEGFPCLQQLLKRKGASLAPETATQVIQTLTAHLVDDDLLVLSLSLSTLTLTLTVLPLAWQTVEQTTLSRIYSLALSGISGSVEPLLAFIAALVRADNQIANHIVQNLLIQSTKGQMGDKAGKGAMAGYATVAKCIAVCVRGSPQDAAGVITTFAKPLRTGKKENDSAVVLALLTLGEIGQFVDMSDQPDVFNHSLNLFRSSSEQVRIAASSAVGGIAVGNIQMFLPVIVQALQGEEHSRLSALHALREVVTHGPRHQLEHMADQLWEPLFASTTSEDESLKNIAAACLGRLTTTCPARFLPRLQASMARENPPAVKAAVATAMRYVFMDNTQTYDDLLQPIISPYFTLLRDTDINVQRLAIVSLNAAARHKSHLVRPHLPNILPDLYAQTHVRDELVHTVVMGPWKHQIDDGLEARKAAYEAMYTLLDTCLGAIDLQEYINRVIAGLSDKDEIKALCYMMLFRLSQVAPTAAVQRLDQISVPLEDTMKAPATTKDTVKQDLERATELQQSAVRALAALVKAGGLGHSARFDVVVENTKKGPLSHDFNELVSK